MADPLIPVNIGTYLRGLTGGRAPIDSDFSDSDKQAILGAVQRALAQSGSTSGSIGYGDYGADSGRFSGWAGNGNGVSFVDALLKSFNDPVFRMETTLGMADYEVRPDGTVVVRDQYDFNAPREVVDDVIARKGSLGAIVEAVLSRDVGFEGLANIIGNLFVAPAGEGRRYEINAGRLPSR